MELFSFLAKRFGKTELQSRTQSVLPHKSVLDYNWKICSEYPHILFTEDKDYPTIRWYRMITNGGSNYYFFGHKKLYDRWYLDKNGEMNNKSHDIKEIPYIKELIETIQEVENGYASV